MKGSAGTLNLKFLMEGLNGDVQDTVVTIVVVLCRVLVQHEFEALLVRVRIVYHLSEMTT